MFFDAGNSRVCTPGDMLIHGVFVGKGGGAIDTNTRIGPGTNFRDNTTGYSNVVIGSNAMQNNTTGANNVAVGKDALLDNFTGNSNIGIGRNALYNTNASNNIGIGTNSLFNSSSGIKNVAIGSLALYSNTTNCLNTAIGYRAQVYYNHKNVIAVGACSLVSANDHTVWGNSNNNVCNCIYVGWTEISDCRDKTEVETLSSDLGLNLIRKLRPVSFKNDHRDTYVRECGFKYGEKDGTLAGEKEHYGLIAQELNQALTELNVRFDALGHDPKKDAYRVTYTELIAPVIKSIQELDERLKIVETRLEI
jgi:hypothetical protein